METKFTKLLNIEHPILMAPMFLVSNKEMLKAAIDSGILGAIPTLNYRDLEQLRSDILELKQYSEGKKGTFALNLIVVGNPFFHAHLQIIEETKAPVVITSLGNPDGVISKVHSYGGIVLSDIVNLKFAEKAATAGADGFVVVGCGAGGHAGNNNLFTLIPSLRRLYPNMLIVAAGGLAYGESMVAALALGADGVSIGTPFITCRESKVSAEYKQAVLNARIDDIVFTRILSGKPSAVINTEKFQELEKSLQNNDMNFVSGMKILSKADYGNVYMAGQSVEAITTETTIGEWITEYIKRAESVQLK
jgi:nitronate monooxygenase